MKNKTVIMVLLSVLCLVILYLITWYMIPLDNDIHIVVTHYLPTTKNNNGSYGFNSLAPSTYIITKQGLLYSANSNYENRDFKKVISLKNKIILKVKGKDEDIIYKILNIKKDESTKLIIE